MLRKKSTLASLVCAVALVGVTTGGAVAGEITGNGKEVPAPERASSVCAFSGQNDTPNAAPPEGGRTQSYGQLVRQGLRADFPSPGTACRGN